MPDTSRSISELSELLGLTNNDYFAVVDTSVEPPETKKVRAQAVLEAVATTQWHTRPGPPSSEDGDPADLWLDTVSGTLWERRLSTNSWVPVGNLRGPEGGDGDEGDAGENGTQWQAEARRPLPEEGAPGDFWLNTQNGDVWQRGESAEDGWGTPIINLHNQPVWTGPADQVTFDTGKGGEGGQETTVQEALAGIISDFDSLELVASKVLYSNPAYESVETVKDALDELMYFSPSANLSLHVPGGTRREIGETITDIYLSWSFNKEVGSVELSGPGTPSGTQDGSGSVDISGLSLTSDASWRVTGSDGKESASDRERLTFRHKRYWGTSPEETLSSAGVLALPGSELASNRRQTRTVSGGGEYIYFAWPTGFGEPAFIINGLKNTAWTRSEIELTNASGHTSTFLVFRTNTVQFGSGLEIQVQ